MSELTAEARAARNAYQRKWRKENRDRVREIENRHWEKVASERTKSHKIAHPSEGDTN